MSRLFALRRAGACCSLAAATLLSCGAHAQVAPPGTRPSAAPAAPAASAAAADNAAPAGARPERKPQRVEITGGRVSEDEQRRQSTAAKIVVGREEIEKFGDATLGEVLRRLPGVTTSGTPGRGGPPRMRGLGNGFTQLLIDGQRIPRGFSLESLTPEQVERIEILRAPTAETGARAIAGTINIVTREGFRRRLNELRLGVSAESGQLTPGLFWNHNDAAGDLSYTINAGAFRPRRESTARVDSTVEDLASGALTRQQAEVSSALERRQGLVLSSRLQWRLGDKGDSLTVMPSVFHNEGRTQRDSVQTQTVPLPVAGAPETLPPYDASRTGSTSRNTSARVNLQWRQSVGDWRLELRGGVRQFESASRSRRETLGGSGGALVYDDDVSARDRSLDLTAKLSSLLGGSTDGSGEHSLVTGLEIEGNQRSDARSSRLNGQPLLTEFGDELSASSLRLAVYAQDEWSWNRHWALHAGLRWEGITTRGQADGGVRPENRSSVATPLVHLLWKPDPKKRDQVRLSLTRSYRSPAVATLIARPNLNLSDPVPGANTPTTPDTVGNPDLRPELASGLDLAFERYLDGGGVLSANLFQRRIRDLMRRVVALESVSWAALPRYVARERNIGDALTRGIELEAKFRLDQAILDAPRVEVRSNLSLYRSRVDGVPGPDNRLDSQAAVTANLGADYRFRGLPLTLGGNVNWVPGYRTRLSEEETTTVGRRRVFDAFALWSFTPAVALRLSGSNLAPEDALSTRTYVAGGTRTATSTTASSAANWQPRLELKL